MLITSNLFTEDVIPEIYKTSMIKSPFDKTKDDIDRGINNIGVTVPTVDTKHEIFQTADQLKNKNKKYTSSLFKKSALTASIV